MTAQAEHLQDDDILLGVFDKYRVRLVEVGQTFGLEDCLTNQYEQPMVEFYLVQKDDAKSFRGRGYFISRYLLTTLLEGCSKQIGLLLDGANPQWSVPPTVMEAILEKAIESTTTKLVMTHVGHWRRSFA